MKTTAIIMFCLITSSLTWSQQLYVAADGVVRITPTAFVHAGGEVAVIAGGDVTIDSDATHSGSFIVSGSTTGNITYKRYIDDANWHLVSAPVTDQSIPTFVGDASNAVTQSGNNYAVSYYNNTNAAGKRWTYHNTVDTAPENQETLTSFIAGQGYSMKRTAAGDYTFTGAMANADVSVTIPTTGGSAHLWSAIANPFPSFLSVNTAADAANLLVNNLAALDTSFAFLYVWNGTSEEYDPIGPEGAALQLAPGQAFMVKAKTDGETFIFNKTLQNHNSGAATFYKSSASTPTISVHLTNGTANKSANLEFLDDSTTGLDVGYDAGAYQDGTPSFSINTHLVSDSQGIDFTRQSLPISSLDSEVAIPLSINAGIHEEVIFSADTNNLPDGVSVYLEDALNNTFTNLTAAPLKIKITAALSGIGRFYLRTSSGVLSTETNLAGALINLYKTSNGTVKVTGLTSGNAATFSLFTILGKEVLATKFIAQNVKEILLPTSLSTGVYIISVVSDLGTFHKKIIIE
ncbi:hypothetical protein BST83_10655 [Polaribacter filamentus]|uniref:Secretion system C-terminal sorting domain-containing protein n=1 Tax=Polaribacter filamentus TaxID=53483 RepID=A0A2S7KYM1_9FLAO|nr:T9SS type A sorting domain-containing protein [Polaribacter filamentus]PQB07568.1 hypothetical protein BST83_10655 [Polaribacter filamentus]